MSVYHISDVTQDGGRALLDGFSGVYGAAIPTPFRHRSYLTDIDDAIDLIAAYAVESDGIEHVNPVDPPAHARMPEYGFQYSACRRWRHDVIGDALRFEFASREKRVLAPYLQAY